MVENLSGGPSRARSLPTWSPDPADLELLRLLADGQTVDAIARRVGVSERTVRRRLRSIADDIGVDSTIEAVVHAVRSRLI
ncbi:helix-turn-helix domain-containing protein [Nocardioides sp.]|jgi:DNA-binding NarL/FixJ family response regulator|uniref:helix-turn-helix domain-containing protein n=1 Tax=Nocardioides sp. TaxID=35761 RepID=UPI0031FF41B8|nr:helix-turn-helix transcriptional regulator [Nocardioides sp.]